MVDVGQKVRKATIEKMRADKDFFAKQDYMKQSVHPMAIEKPSDLGDFILSEYLSGDNAEAFTQMGTVFESIGVSASESERMQRAGRAIAFAIGNVMITNKTARDEALKAFDEPAN
jgi:hypothetical protein